MTTLEKIKAEIQKPMRKTRILDTETQKAQMIALAWCLEIIDKYAEQEPSRDIKEIAEIMKCDADAETKCKMISNILTVKPHYFAEQEPTSPCDLCKFNTKLMLIEANVSGYAQGLKESSKTGHWILLDECANSGYYCSECQKKLVKEGWSNTVKKIKYCPNCGCRMESEDKK